MPGEGLTNANSRPLSLRTTARKRAPGVFEKALGDLSVELLEKLYERMPPQNQREFWTLDQPRDEKIAYLMIHGGVEINGGRA